MYRATLFSFALLAASFTPVHASSTKSQVPAENQIPVKGMPVDPKTLATAINGSYYHPDQLSGIQCAVSVDWRAFYSALNVKVPEARMHTLDGLQIHYSVARNKKPEFSFSWLNGQADTADQLQDGLQQMVSGFYQIYWPMMASAPIPDAKEIKRVEPQPDGALKIFESDPNNKAAITLDKNNAPAHWDFESPASKGTFDLDFTDNPNPVVAGDIRRLSNMHVVLNTGATTMNVKIGMDYQPIEGIMIPRHVNYELVGAYSISLEFIGCTVTKSTETKGPPAQ